jgi:hypothetical protein
MDHTTNTHAEGEKAFRFQLTDYWKKRIHEIQIEGEIKAEYFASQFRFFFIGFLVIFSILSRLGGIPVVELYGQLGILLFHPKIQPMFTREQCLLFISF